MANKIYQFQYDDEIDEDIHEFIERYPRSRKAEMVRQAIRFYLTFHGRNLTPTMLPTSTNVVKEVEKKRTHRPLLSLGGIENYEEEEE